MSRLHLPIQNPCHEDWTAMSASDGARRFCDVCTKHVHDVSAMTEVAARATLAAESAKGRGVCVRYTLDPAGNIKFKPQTVEASSLWRMTLAAAGIAMALMTGCADAEPDRILPDQCVYEVGVWSFTTERGQGTCPAVEPEPEEPMMMGEIEAVIEPVDPVLTLPIREVKGDIGPDPVDIPEPVEVEVLGEAPMIEPPPPTPPPQVMGKIAPVQPDPVDPKQVEIEVMGDIAAPTDPIDPLDPLESPCDPDQDQAQAQDRPLRL